MSATKLHPASLPRLLSLLPQNGVSASVYQTRWEAKRLPVPSPLSPSPSLDHTCRWVVEKVNLGVSDEGKPWAKAFGVLYWKGEFASAGHFAEQATADSQSTPPHSAHRQARHTPRRGREDQRREQVPVDERGPPTGAGEDGCHAGCD